MSNEDEPIVGLYSAKAAEINGSIRFANAKGETIEITGWSRVSNYLWPDARVVATNKDEWNYLGPGVRGRESIEEQEELRPTGYRFR